MLGRFVFQFRINLFTCKNFNVHLIFYPISFFENHWFKYVLCTKCNKINNSMDFDVLNPNP